MDSMLSFSYFPIRFMSTLGVMFFLVSVIWMICVLIEKITVGTPILGWASLMCIVLFSFGCMMLMMGILGEYVWRALDASRNRPPYLIDVVKKAEDTSLDVTDTDDK